MTDSKQKIGKTEIVERIAQSAGIPKTKAGEVYDAAGDIIVGALKDGLSVGLPGLGTFTVKATAARTGVKPGTSEKIQIPAGKKVSFKMASDLKGTL